MPQYSTFNPVYGSNITVTTAATSASVALAVAVRSLRIKNTGAVLAYVRVGINPVTATIADMPIAPDETVVIHKRYGDNRIAYIHQGVISTTLQIQSGEGE